MMNAPGSKRLADADADADADSFSAGVACHATVSSSCLPMKRSREVGNSNEHGLPPLVCEKISYNMVKGGDGAQYPIRFAAFHCTAPVIPPGSAGHWRVEKLLLPEIGDAAAG
ncbi:hypothetical protein G6M04_29605 [Agrobacterium rhizogenes]|uniref:hypothetical protein n=1 Tax=Rhizobium rhizogenes TaxID=359 RepID=UPI00157246DB|nr:hypothetical protein [Rhizobium rhizogenes]NTG51564.1 hypothetical protein [Rhizobium rhizogenes]